VRSEADFYGAMDGASKFVRGDATAGILILVINIVGGLAIGVLSHGMGFTDAARVYTLLTIGDGLVAQIPGAAVVHRRGHHRHPNVACPGSWRGIIESNCSASLAVSRSQAVCWVSWD
jgi:hypothetical protein